MTRPADLPDFTDPPIDEVAIGVQFPNIDGLIQPLFGLLWSRFRDKYPRVESQPRIEGPIENLYEPANLVPMIPLQFPSPPARTWYLANDDEHLVQVQDTRFVQNWRRRNSPYERFDVVKNDFWESFNHFREMLRDESLGLPVIQQLELTYINWIPQNPPVEMLRIGDASSLSVPRVVEQPESVDWSGRYLIDDGGVHVARLYLQYLHANRNSPPNPGPGTQFALIFRAPMIEGMSDARLDELLEMGRETIVRVFAEMTTDAAHKLWGRVQ